MAELLDDTVDHGEGVRLNWSADDEARAHSWWRVSGRMCKTKSGLR